MPNEFRPGPDRLEPGLVPGGIVVHTYDQRGDLLLEQKLDADSDVAGLAAMGSRIIGDRVPRGEAVCIVTFDGDSGDRIIPDRTTPGPDRAERRRRARAERRGSVIVGDGIVAHELPGHRYEAKPHAEPPDKVPGRHRWIALATWILGPDVAGMEDPDVLKYLDHENLWSLSVGCLDCEQPLGVIAVDSPCPAEGWTEGS